jgi:hypothetical protein
MPVTWFKTARSGNQKFTSWGEDGEDFFLPDFKTAVAS